MDEDVVTRLEERIAELIDCKQRLAVENARLLRAQKAYEADRKRCRRQLDAVLDKVDRLARGAQ